jgi:hypothetical protein
MHLPLPSEYLYERAAPYPDYELKGDSDEFEFSRVPALERKRAVSSA